MQIEFKSKGVKGISTMSIGNQPKALGQELGIIMSGILEGALITAMRNDDQQPIKVSLPGGESLC